MYIQDLFDKICMRWLQLNLHFRHVNNKNYKKLHLSQLRTSAKSKTQKQPYADPMNLKYALTTSISTCATEFISCVLHDRLKPESQ